jgi:hypothetical protein
VGAGFTNTTPYRIAKKHLKENKDPFTHALTAVGVRIDRNYHRNNRNKECVKHGTAAETAVIQLCFFFPWMLRIYCSSEF